MSNTARPFARGQRVEATDHAFESGLFLRTRKPVLGIVTGFGISPLSVIVRRDGLKTASSYHVDFWQPSGAELPPDKQTREIARLRSEVSRLTGENEAKDKIIEAIERTPLGSMWEIRRAIAELKASRPARFAPPQAPILTQTRAPLPSPRLTMDARTKAELCTLALISCVIAVALWFAVVILTTRPN